MNAVGGIPMKGELTAVVGASSKLSGRVMMLAGIVGLVLFLSWFHRRSTPTTIPSASIEGVLSMMREDEQYIWGTYRGNLYFGMRMARPTSLMTGMMWFGMQDFASCKSKAHTMNDHMLKFVGIRHECSMQDGMRWGWVEHDGNNYGKEVLEDFENNLRLTITYLKSSGISQSALH